MNIIKIFTLICVINLMNVSAAFADEQCSISSDSSVVLDINKTNHLDDTDDVVVFERFQAKVDIQYTRYQGFANSFQALSNNSAIRAPPIKN